MRLYAKKGKDYRRNPYCIYVIVGSVGGKEFLVDYGRISRGRKTGEYEIKRRGDYSTIDHSLLQEGGIMIIRDYNNNLPKDFDGDSEFELLKKHDSPINFSGPINTITSGFEPVEISEEGGIESIFKIPPRSTIPERLADILEEHGYLKR